eukprot:CAMPEP_0168597406 /NCGR_PEP_ID=MMETSP0420-20121227/10650_1 /TAXON_ID=498008 /ORGANISM="Pessonella sp." /LENGTH=137 /DNA_ID=CAMNT_0008634261 /DNA_START=27 /DNA_END=437 /DNA_ORIENTATION=+
MADGDQTEIRNRAHRNNNAVVNQWRQEHGLAPLDSKKLQTIVDDDIVEHLVAVPNLPDPVEEHGRKATNLVASSKGPVNVDWLHARLKAAELELAKLRHRMHVEALARGEEPPQDVEDDPSLAEQHARKLELNAKLN